MGQLDWCMGKRFIDPFAKIQKTRPGLKKKKQLATVVSIASVKAEHVEAMVDNPFARLEDKADPTVPTATLEIYKTIGQVLERKEVGTANRCSSATMCSKRNWYQNQGLKGEELTPRKIVNFLLGDLSERTLLYFIKTALVGPGKLYSEIDLGDVVGTFQFQGKFLELYEQKTFSFKIGAIEITGHFDGFGKRNSDGQWEMIECKSSTNFGFKKFKDEGPKDYLRQSHAGMMTKECRARNVKSVRYFYLRKETGHLWDSLHQYDDEIAHEVVTNFIIANSPVEPKAPHELIEEKGKLVANFPCTYCPYLKMCKGEHEVEWKKNYQNGTLKPLHVFTKGKKDAV